MKQMEIQDYFTLVYILGWLVVCIGVYLTIKAGLTSGHDDIGLSVIFGGLYMTSFVKNSQLKLQITQMEQERQKR